MPQPAFLDADVVRRRSSLGEGSGALDVIGEEGELRAGRRRLAHERHSDGTVLGRRGEAAPTQRRGLVHDVADEDAAEYRTLGRKVESASRFGVAPLDRVDLLGEAQTRRCRDADIVLGFTRNATEALAGDPVPSVHARAPRSTAAV